MATEVEAAEKEKVAAISDGIKKIIKDISAVLSATRDQLFVEKDVMSDTAKLLKMEPQSKTEKVLEDIEDDFRNFINDDEDKIRTITDHGKKLSPIVRAIAKRILRAMLPRSARASVVEDTIGQIVDELGNNEDKYLLQVLEEAQAQMDKGATFKKALKDSLRLYKRAQVRMESYLKDSINALTSQQQQQLHQAIGNAKALMHKKGLPFTQALKKSLTVSTRRAQTDWDYLNTLSPNLQGEIAAELPIVMESEGVDTADEALEIVLKRRAEN